MIVTNEHILMFIIGVAISGSTCVYLYGAWKKHKAGADWEQEAIIVMLQLAVLMFFFATVYFTVDLEEPTPVTSPIREGTVDK